MERNKRRLLQQDMEELLDLVRYDGLLPGTAQFPVDGLLADTGPLTDDAVLETLSALAGELDSAQIRAQFDALLQSHEPAHLPEQATPVGETMGDAEGSPENSADADTIELADSAPPVLDTPMPVTESAAESTDPGATADAQPEHPRGAPVAVLSESLESHEHEHEHEHEHDIGNAALTTEGQDDLFGRHEPGVGIAASPAEEALDPFDVAQTVTAQLMNRLDATLAESFPPAVYDSFAEFYFQFSAKVCERLMEEDSHTLIVLMSQEAARDAG